MPDSILTIILVGVIGLIVLAILLKLCNRFPFLNYLFIFGSALALCIICFSVKPYNPGSVHDDKFKGAAAIWQAVLVAMYVMFLWADIAASLIAVLTAQALTYRLETAENRLKDYFYPALMLLTLYYLMFFSFTIFPPKTELFRDPVSGGFGIVEKIAEKEG